MPFSSKAQAAAMHAAAAGKSTIGIPAKVGKKFVSEGHGQKLGPLPAHKTLKKQKRALRKGDRLLNLPGRHRKEKHK